MMKNFFRKYGRGCALTILLVCGALSALTFAFRNTLSRYLAPVQLLFEHPDYATLETPAQFETYLTAEPDSFSLVAYTVNQDGTADAGTALRHRADQPLPLASTVKIALLAAYAQAETDGRIHPDDPVPFAAWEAFYLPGTDGGAHQSALQNLGHTPTEAGFAPADAPPPTVDDLVWAMIRYSDNAATDWLLTELGVEQVNRALTTELGFDDHQPIAPFTGQILLWQNHGRPEVTAEWVDDIQAMSMAERHAAGRDLWQRYTTDEAWRTAEIEWRQSKLPIYLPYEIGLARTTTRATAADYARVMGRIVTDNYLSAAHSAVMRRYLEWPMREFPNNADRFETMGSKGGSLAGVLTEATYYVPADGPYAGQPRVVVLFQRPVFAAWLAQQQSFIQQRFAAKLATDEAYVDDVKAMLTEE